tara:strand:- start:2240 stop:2524 length:285 start_codon:yes stop_codon:yes gene_type:complete
MSKKYFDEAIKNIRDDRAVTSKMLMDILAYIGADNEKHKDVGAVVAKYLETLQRSNEQLVKLVTLIEKKSDANQGLTDKDKDEIFDLLTKSEAS